MSRVAKCPIYLPENVLVKLKEQNIWVSGAKGTLHCLIHNAVEIIHIDHIITCKPFDSSFVNGWAQAGTARALIKIMIVGVTEGFEKRLQLVGIGYRAFMKGKILNLALGFSHLIEYKIPSGITVECPSPTEIILKGIDKQLIGQTAANIYCYKKPDPYKGKGIRYINQVIRLKEAKKK
ncbi:MAG: 50S ribosomal protein L6 [Candidatus Dasytiphilus stammeri]